MQSEVFFHAFAMVCLAPVFTKSKSLNWGWVKICGLLFRSATVGSGGKVTRNIVERILNTSIQKELAIGHSHQMCKC